MVRYLLTAAGSGLLLGVLDGVLNGNPLAAGLLAPYKPLARKSLNMAAGILIDLMYGFALAGLFLLLYRCLPGGTGILKGLSFAAGAWFLRFFMNAASSWVMFEVPLKTIAYQLAAGLVEMAALGVLYGLVLAG